MRPSSSISALAVICAVALGACTRTDEPVLQPPPAPALSPQASAALIARGEVLVQRHCAACHAVEASGASPRPPAPALRDLSQRYPPEALEEAFAEGILVGHPEMPEFRFEPADIDAIVAYLHAVQARKRS